MFITAFQEEIRRPDHEPPGEEGITVNYWRMGQEGHLDHFGLLVSVQVGQHRVTWTMDMQPQCTHSITVDGRIIALVAGAWEISIEAREHGEHLGLVTLIDNDEPLPG